MPTLPQIGPPSTLATPGTFEVPQENPAVQALTQSAREIQQAGTAVIAGTRRMQLASDVAEATGKLQLAQDGARLSLLNDRAFMDPIYKNSDSGAAAAAFTKEYQQRIAPLGQAIADQYPNFKQDMKANIAIHQAEAVRTAQAHFLTLYEQNARARFTGPAMQVAADNIVSKMLQNGPRDPNALHEQANFHDAINTIPGFGPDERDVLHAEFEHRVSLGLLNAQALSDPGAVLTSSTPPPGIPANEWMAAKNLALENQNMNYRRVETAVHAQQAENDMIVWQSIADNKPVPELDFWKSRGLVSDAAYEAKTGMRYQPTFMSEAGLPEFYTRMIAEANPADIPIWERQIEMARSNRQLNGIDQAKLMLQAGQAKNRKVTDMDKAKTHYLDLLHSEFYPPEMPFLRRFDLHVPVENAEAHWKALTAGAKTPADFEDQWPKMQDWMKVQMKNSFATGKHKDDLHTGVPAAP